jgi:hypothetical protein
VVSTGRVSRNPLHNYQELLNDLAMCCKSIGQKEQNTSVIAQTRSQATFTLRPITSIARKAILRGLDLVKVIGGKLGILRDCQMQQIIR